MTRIVELIRVSTDTQRERGTQEVQRRDLDKLREVRPGQLVERIEALGVSGAKGVSERPDLQRLVELSQQRAYDELRVWNVDRLTRSDDLRERAAIFGAVADAGAKIVDCSSRVIDPKDDSGMGELDYFLQTLFAARERKKIAARTAAGKRLRASQGRMVHGIPPYGRRFNKVTGAWELVPKEVEIYRRIIDSYLDGATVLQIVRALNAEGVPSKRQRWGCTTIKRLLRKPSIVGLYTAFGHTMQIPPIATHEEWERIKATLDQRVSRAPGTKPVEALLRGHGFCAACGHALWVYTCGAHKGQPRYGCPKPSRRETPCPARRTIRVKDADEVVRNALLNMVRRPEVFARAIAKASNHVPDPEKALRAIDAELSRLTTKEAKTLRLYNDGLLSDDVAKTELTSLRSTRADAEKRRKVAQAAAAQVSPADLEGLRTGLAAAMTKASPARMNELLTILRPTIKLTATGIEVEGVVPVRHEVRSSTWSACRKAR